MKNSFSYLALIIVLTISCFTFSACSSDDDVSVPKTETVDLYGTTIPYTPLEEQSLPEWLIQLKSDKKMMGLHSICVGTLKDKDVYILDVWTDSYGGRMYDKDGNLISIDLYSFMAFVDNLRCIYINKSYICQ